MATTAYDHSRLATPPSAFPPKKEDDLDLEFDEAELDRILNQEASQVTREAEVRLPFYPPLHLACLERTRGLTLTPPPDGVGR